MPKVLIAGIAGFLGSHIAELFSYEGWQVSGVDNLTKFELNRTGYNVEKARNYNVNFLKSIGAELIVEDIRNKYELRKAAKGCDYIINCAAQPAMTIALERPCFDAENNIMGTLNILEIAHEFNIPAATCSTIHVYGNGINEKLSIEEDGFHYNFPEDGFSINENHFVLSGSITPLHVSKYTTELYARAFTESYGSKTAVFRLTGIYGPRQLGGEDHGWVANFTIRTLLERPIKVFGTDKQVRDILYVTDAAQSFLDWYEHNQPSGVYNIGGGIPCITSIRQCLQKLKEITGKEQNVTLEPARPGDLWYFCCDTTKALHAFGWKPSVLPDAGLNKLVNWVEENKAIFGG